MANRKYDVMHKAGTYKKDGEEKGIWLKCGTIFEKEGRFSLKMDAVPVGDWNGWLSLFPADKPKATPAPPDDSDDDFPF